ncbi:MAG: NAD(P)/FAD-dependent oxidoreductase [Nitrososphaerota archaeon]|nr:NAD(P)/FAD-dependent oxidoreductase [Nitrososphaerota archaeon]
MSNYDAIVVGAGHNGLVTAGYLSKQGLKVLVLEKSHVAGGCVRTEELFPGFKVNVYSFEQYLIHSTSIIEDLELATFGLRYYSVDPTIFSPFKDGKFMLFYKDLDRTVKHIERFSSHDAKAYRELVEEFEPLNDLLGGMSQSPPISILDLAISLKGTESERLFQVLFSSAKEILEEQFETEYVKVPMAFLGPAAIGLAPSQKGTGWTVGWHLLGRKLARPYGGTGQLISALVKMLEYHSSEVLLNSEVKNITIKNGKASGVELKDGRKFESKIVVAACDPKQTLLKLVGEEHLDSELVSGVKRIKVANGIAMKADYILEGLPIYSCNPTKGVSECHKAATYISESVDSLEKAYDEYKYGCNPKVPALMVALHTAGDSSLAPSGKHILSLETRYTPYELADGSSWDEIKDEVADNLLEIYSEYCPNVRKLVSKRYVASPVDWERDLNLPRGNFLHADMSIDQLFSLRPAIGLSKYKTPIGGLYITGAGTHPGGGVSGAAGYNAAQAILQEMN